MAWNFLKRQPPKLNPFLLLFSTGGHVLLFFFFTLQLQILPPTPADSVSAALEVSLVRPTPQPLPAPRSRPVFPRDERERTGPVIPPVGTVLVDTIPEALPDTTPKIPPGLGDPNDCLLKTIGDICPKADLSCIAGYMAFCFRMF